MHTVSFKDGSIQIPHNFKIQYLNKLEVLYSIHHKNGANLKEISILLSKVKTTPTKYFEVINDDNES